MKIILDIPDTTICAFFDFVFADYYSGLMMQGHSIKTDELHEGAVIKIDAMRHDIKEIMEK